MGDYTIHVTVDGSYGVDEDNIRLAAWHGLTIAGAETPCALTVTVTSAERVHELNREYAGVDSATDVLAFSPEGDPYATEPGEPPYIGDVLIAYPVAEQQAQESGIPTLIEVQTLAVHGVLHLLGYDHDTPERRAEMWALQSAAMDAVRAAGNS
jgi:probable rRNA maturation factor